MGDILKIIIITQDEPFYLGKYIDYLFANLPSWAEVSGVVVLDASPFGKPTSFLDRIMKTYNVFGGMFFLRYTLKYIYTKLLNTISGAPAFGTPEYMKAALIGGQLARRYGFPYRSSAVCAANTVDAQAAWETVYSLWGAIQGGANYIKHSTGWLEGGLCASFEKFIVDVDIMQMVSEFMKPLEINDDTLALDAMREVGPGGHFFGCQHTQDRYKDAFYAPLISDWRNFEAWEEAGSPEAMGKANGIWKQALEEYEEPALDPAIKEELDAFVAKRIEEGGVPTDF